MTTSRQRAIRLALVLLATRVAGASDCPEPTELVRHPGWIEQARAYYHTDTLPGQNGQLIAGYSFDPTTIPQTASLAITYEKVHLACGSQTVVTEHEYELGPNSELRVVVFVGQERTQDVWDLLLFRNKHELGFVYVLGTGQGVNLGDWSLLYLDAAVPKVSFVRNNVAVRLMMSPALGLDLLALAQAIDAQLLAKPTFAALADSGLLPQINQFTLDLPVGTAPAKLKSVPLLLDVTDPSGLPITNKLRADHGESVGIAAMNVESGPPARYFFQPFLRGSQEIKLISFNTLGLMARTSFSTDVESAPGDPQASIANLASTIECTLAESTPVPLDASSSIDADGSIVTFAWQPAIRMDDPTSATPIASLPLGVGQHLGLTVVDNDGHTDQAAVTLDIVDTTPPTFGTLPADEVVECDAVPAPPEVLAQDPCSEVRQSFQEESVSRGCLFDYDLRRTWTAVDAFNNLAQQSQTIMVFDTLPPSLLNTPASLDLRCDDELPIPASVLANDNCSGAVAVDYQQSIESGSCIDNYVVRRRWSAADDCQNQATDEQTISFTDSIEPLAVALLRPMQLPAAPVSPLSACAPPTNRAFAVVCAATDACDPAPAVSANLQVVQHTVSDDGDCAERIDEITVNCGETLEISLVPPACALSPRSAAPPLSVDSRGMKHVRGEVVELVVTAIDRCGNRDDATYNPAIEPSSLCEQQPVGEPCCPAIAAEPPCSTPCRRRE